MLEINKMETKRIHRANQSWFFEKAGKIDESLANLAKRKREKLKMYKSGDQRSLKPGGGGARL